jgi:predicted site-specific integrase-resolvase
VAAKSVAEAKQRLDDEYGQFRRHLDSIHDAFDKVVSANADDDIYERVQKLEKTVKEVRDGGIVGSGLNGHRRALKDYKEALEAEKKGTVNP